MVRAAHAHDHSCCTSPGSTPAERLDGAEQLCLARGVRLTGQRRQVLAALIETGRALGAYDLIEQVAARAGKRMAPITVYRALDFLIQEGLVHRIESRNAFLACPGGHGAHAQAVFLICESCGSVAEATSTGLDKEIARIAGQTGFQPKLRVIEVTGSCAPCALAKET